MANQKTRSKDLDSLIMPVVKGNSLAEVQQSIDDLIRALENEINIRRR
jgi:hypothetical protein